MRGHKSHQLGVDVDIRPLRNDGQEGPVRYQSGEYSRALTQQLVNIVRANSILPVKLILFNDPAVTGVSAYPNHDDHLHVRFQPPARADRRPQPTPVPPATPSGRATLADLASFSRSIIDQIRAAGQTFDCADLAIEIWVRFGERYNIPVSFRTWDTRSRRYVTIHRGNFRSVDAFARYARGHLGARDLIRNTYEVPGGHRAAGTGDVYLWEYTHKVTGLKHRWGHTQILYAVQRSSAGPAADRITIVQGSLPAIVPEFRSVPASYFNQPRQVDLTMNSHKEPHIGLLVGDGPRRFNGFQNLR